MLIHYIASGCRSERKDFDCLSQNGMWRRASSRVLVASRIVFHWFRGSNTKRRGLPVACTPKCSSSCEARLDHCVLSPFSSLTRVINNVAAIAHELLVSYLLQFTHVSLFYMSNNLHTCTSCGCYCPIHWCYSEGNKQQSHSGVLFDPALSSFTRFLIDNVAIRTNGYMFIVGDILIRNLSSFSRFLIDNVAIRTNGYMFIVGDILIRNRWAQCWFYTEGNRQQSHPGVLVDLALSSISRFLIDNVAFRLLGQTTTADLC